MMSKLLRMIDDPVCNGDPGQTLKIWGSRWRRGGVDRGEVGTPRHTRKDTDLITARSGIYISTPFTMI